MTRLRFLLVSFFAAVGAVFGIRRRDRSRERIKAHFDDQPPFTREQLTAAGNRTGKRCHDDLFVFPAKFVYSRGFPPLKPHA